MYRDTLHHNVTVGIVGGSDLVKIREQLGDNGEFSLLYNSIAIALDSSQLRINS